MKTNDKPTIVVTGGASLVGAAVATDLARDHRVVCLDGRAPEAEPGLQVDHIECDFTSDESTAHAFAELRERCGGRIASVIHLAEYRDYSDDSSPRYRELNVEGTARVLEQLRTFEVEQLTYSSTLLVMKPIAPGHRITELSPTESRWAYPKSKRAAERVVVDAREGIPAVTLRIATVYDDGCHSTPLAHQIQRIYEKTFDSHFFPGNRSHGQSFVHVEDLVACIRRTVERRNRLSSFETFLVGEPDVMSYGDLQDAIGNMLHGNEWTTIRIPKAAAKTGAWLNEQLSDERRFVYPPWMVDIADAHYAITIDKAEQKLGWTPRRSLSEMLPNLIERVLIDPKSWYQENGLTWTEGLEEALATLRRLR